MGSCGNVNSCCTQSWGGNSNGNGTGRFGYAFILVLFILLVICGAAFIF